MIIYFANAKKEYVQAQIQTLSESDDNFLMIKTLNDGYFLFPYNGNKIRRVEEKFSKPGWIIYDFPYNKIIAVKVQIHSRNFKMHSQ